jgi:hypothetical protein
MLDWSNLTLAGISGSEWHRRQNVDEALLIRAAVCKDYLRSVYATRSRSSDQRGFYFGRTPHDSRGVSGRRLEEKSERLGTRKVSALTHKPARGPRHGDHKNGSRMRVKGWPPHG